MFRMIYHTPLTWEAADANIQRLRTEITRAHAQYGERAQIALMEGSDMCRWVPPDKVAVQSVKAVSLREAQAIAAEWEFEREKLPRMTSMELLSFWGIARDVLGNDAARKLKNQLHWRRAQKLRSLNKSAALASRAVPPSP